MNKIKDDPWSGKFDVTGFLHVVSLRLSAWLKYFIEKLQVAPAVKSAAGFVLKPAGIKSFEGN
jgi:hypothetical protein